MDFQVKLTGTDQILKNLGALPERVGRNAMRRALRKGANVIRDAARVNARRVDDTLTRENIAKNIVTQGGGRKFEKREGGPAMRVGVLGGAKSKRGGGTYAVGGSKANPGGDTFYWRFLEFGTSQMAARPFMRPAMNEGASKAFPVITDAMATETAKELAKLGVAQ